MAQQQASAVYTSLQRTHKAKSALQRAPEQLIKKTLRHLADEIIAQTKTLIRANEKDLARQDPANPRNDRLMLNEQRIRAIAAAMKKVAGLPDPTNKILEERVLDNGLSLTKKSVPLGVVGAIYESRPNVTFDIAGLCLRSRNACVLKGSSEAEHTNEAAVKLIKKVLKSGGLPAELVTLLPSERSVVEEMFKATEFIDVIIPRGSDSLIRYVRKNSLVPVIETGAGVCHVYVESDADLKMALNIVVNAKTSRPSVCNAADAILVDQSVAEKFCSMLAPEFQKHQVEIFADKNSYRLLKGYPHLQPAKPEHFGQEFLSMKCAVKIVHDLDDALNHIAQYSTRHSEAIVSKNKKAVRRFLQEVDAAVVYANASTRFTDGEEFGLGAEIGISTQKLHARGPFALEKLVTEKWVIEGEGQIR